MTSMLQTEGFVLSVAGFNHKLHLLLSKIVDMMFELTVSHDRISAVIVWIAE